MVLMMICLIECIMQYIWYIFQEFSLEPMIWASFMNSKNPTIVNGYKWYQIANVSSRRLCVLSILINHELSLLQIFTNHMQYVIFLSARYYLYEISYLIFTLSYIITNTVPLNSYKCPPFKCQCHVCGWLL